jgi:adenine-specific DNA-methyltransferase
MTEQLEPERLDLNSLDIAAEKQAELLRLFPEVRTEGGKVDFERLRLALGETVDAGKERYGMNWPGKADCFKAIQRPSLGTLLPVREESLNFDETENLIIEGDNLEVLKLLQKSYQGKVKMIYIDPPYNTGNDFIYPDKYSESLQTYLEYTGQVDNEGRRFSNNTETDGRFHSKWLSMMYPRLYLARNLLTEDGMIFISINDVELANLAGLCNEVFGEENHFATFIWINEGNIDNQSRIKVNHEYVVVYARNEKLIPAPPIIDPNIPETSKLFRDTIENTIVKNGPANPVSPIVLPVGFPADFEEGNIEPKQDFWPQLSNSVSVFGGKTVNTVTASSGWSSKDIAEEFIRGGFVPVKDIKGQETTFFLSKTGAIFSRKNRLESQSHVLSVLRGMGTVQAAASSLAELGITFSYPKPTELIEYLVRIGSTDDDLVLDFFAGSGTLGEAVLKINRKGASRRFILVQLPEKTKTQGENGIWVDSEESKAGFETISDITKERIRRVIQRGAKEAGEALKLGNRSTEGFRALKLATSNFNVWDATTETTTPDALGQQLELHVNHIQQGRSSEDLLYEVLLKSGFPLTTPVETFGIEGKTVHGVANGAMLICLDLQLTHETIKGIADLKPERVICLDEGFAGNDQLKTNAVLIMKAKGVTKFQTI